MIVPQDSESSKLRTYPDLSAFCLRARLDLPYRLWLICRQAAPCGWLTETDVFDLSCGNEKQTRRWLMQGFGKFWHISGNRLYIHSLGRVCQALNVKLKRKPVDVPLADVKNLIQFRAVLFATWFAGSPKTLSQKLLGEIFGRQPRTLYTWCGLAGVEIQHNMVWSHLPNEQALKVYPVGVMAPLGMKVPEEEAAKPDKTKFWLECWNDYPHKPDWQYQKGKKAVLVRPFVNTYSVEMDQGPKTRLQRQAARGVKKGANPFLCHGLEENPARPPVKGRILYPWFPYIEDKEVFKARLSKRKQGITKSLQRNGFAFIEGQAQHHGARLWQFQTLA